MAKTFSTMLEIGTAAPNFSLPNIDGSTVRNSDFTGKKGLLVMFICNHCPYVIHVQHELASIGSDYQAKDIAIVGISSNDITTHPTDSPELMVEKAREVGYTFPYLFDESQEVAKAYKAACTPDIFLFDDQQKLVYRGQIDSSRPSNGLPVSGSNLREALDAVVDGGSVSTEQNPSMGCNIKWKEGNSPEYYG